MAGSEAAVDELLVDAGLNNFSFSALNTLSFASSDTSTSDAYADVSTREPRRDGKGTEALYQQQDNADEVVGILVGDDHQLYAQGARLDPGVVECLEELAEHLGPGHGDEVVPRPAVDEPCDRGVTVEELEQQGVAMDGLDGVDGDVAILGRLDIPSLLGSRRLLGQIFGRHCR